jgi:isocitrate dehydrogenase (NAD+)
MKSPKVVSYQSNLYAHELKSQKLGVGDGFVRCLLLTAYCLTEFMAHRITLIPGDGIGPEVASAVVSIIDAAGVEIDWEEHIAGQPALDKFGVTLPDELLESIKRNKVGLKGPITTPVGKGFTSVNVGLRKALDLYANLRPIRALPNVPCRNPTLDLVVVRENTESLYSGLEHEIIPGVVESLKIITEKASTRIAHFAFDYALSENRKKISAVHKANIMKLSDGLFLRCFHKVAEHHPQIKAEDMIVDNASMQLVMRPEQFDVLLCENLYGDIVSDLCAGLIGGLGLVPGANIGEKGAVFEAVHGSAPDIAGKGIANPTALLQSAILMLRHIEERAAADRIEKAMLRTFEAGKVRTRDIGGSATTNEFADAIITGLQ